MRLITHLSFDGTCEAAFRLYEQCLGAEITFLLKCGDSPMASTLPGMEDKVLHATLKVGDQVITGVDTPLQQYETPQGFSVQLNLDSESDAERIFATFADGGAVRLPLQKTFWADRYGIVVDRFGTPWELNYTAAA